VFVTGAGDSSVKIWDVGTARGRRRGNSKGVWPNEPVDDIHDGDVLGLVYEDELEAEGADGEFCTPLSMFDLTYFQILQTH
jgi:hypothetical protein